MKFEQIYDPALSQYAYLIGCPGSGQAIVIDPERDIDRYLKLADDNSLNIVAVAETHIHADFLSGARELAERVNAKLYLSSGGKESGWESLWAKQGNYQIQFLNDGDPFTIGNILFTAMHTPGHTPEHLSYFVKQRGASTPLGILTGDFVFTGEMGRPDLLETAAGVQGTREASAKTLYASGRRLLEMQDSDHLVIWPGHGAGSACGKGLSALPHSTLGYELRENIALQKVREGEEAFVHFILEGQTEPPLYFARMKQCNRDGVPRLRQLPQPRSLTVQELAMEVEGGETLFIDTRGDRQNYFEKHLPNSLYIPLNNMFCTAVGSLIESETQRLGIIVDPHQREDAVRRLVRIGFDNIAVSLDYATLIHYFMRKGQSKTIPSISFKTLEQHKKGGAVVVDVRFASEYREGHIPDAIHAPYTRLPEHLEAIPKDKPLLVHCFSGFRAALASAYLQQQGRDVIAIDDTFGNYRAVGRLVQ